MLNLSDLGYLLGAYYSDSFRNFLKLLSVILVSLMVVVSLLLSPLVLLSIQLIHLVDFSLHILFKLFSKVLRGRLIAHNLFS